MTQRFALLAVVALAAGACGSDDSGPAAGPVPTVPDGETPATSTLDGDWDVFDLTVDGARIDLPDDRRLTVSIDGDQISGVAACNGYGGVLASEPGAGSGSFVVTELSWTEMACELEVMAVEQSFLAALQAADSYEVADDVHVAATGTGTSFRLVRQVPVEDIDLVGTTWILDTHLSGGAASNSSAMASAFLEFGADGTLVGSTGCRRLEGTWQVQGTLLVVPVLAAIDDPTAGVCAPEHERLDGIVIGVVESGVTVDIDGRRLTLTAPDGEGLSFRASPGVDAGT